MTNNDSFNLADAVCHKHKDAIYRVALEEAKLAGVNTYTYGGLAYLSDKFAAVLMANGIKAGARVAVALAPSAAMVVAHFGALKIGAQVVVVSDTGEAAATVDGIKAAKAQVVVFDEAGLAEYDAWRQSVGDAATAFVVSAVASKHDFGAGVQAFWFEINFADVEYEAAATHRETPAYELIGVDGEAGEKLSHGHFAEGERTGEEEDCLLRRDAIVSRAGLEAIYAAWFGGRRVRIE